ncbi:Mss4-like protein [Schizothecium vesticola]|uniref:Mss4-like protein n=1 Tax=Schizothecium vesticola TaxID=314040 RepID=A0AA40BPT4_9PEZI|nr:Mss4-like protein [Schizothecium vesticola]
MSDSDHKPPRDPSQDKRSDGTEPHQHQAGSSTHRPEDEWKFRPPYRIAEHSPSEFSVKWRGKCHCGAVRYELSRARPLASKYCHCTTCQRLHGAPFQWAAIFHKTDINFTQGHHDLGWYDAAAKSTTHHLPCKVQCAYCRTPVMDEGRNMILLFPTLIEGINTDEGRSAFKAGCHMFYGQRVVEVRDGLPKWKGMNDDSVLLDEETGEEIEGGEGNGGGRGGIRRGRSGRGSEREVF